MQCKVSAAGEGESLTVVGDVLTFKLCARDTGERFVLGEVVVGPGGGPPPHLHEREDELFYVLDGQADFFRHDTRYCIAPGHAAWAPRNIVHTFKNTGQRPLRMLVIALPCNFENFYRECGEPFQLGQPLPAPTPQSVQKLLATAPKYGLQILPEHQFPGSGNVGGEKSSWVLGELVTLKLTSKDTGGNFCLCTIASPPGGGPPAHAHRAEDEILYIIEGRYELLLGDRTRTVAPGATVFIPRGTTHFYKNAGQTTGRLVSIHTPGGLERFFEEAGVSCTDVGTAPPAVDLARIMPLMARYGMDMPSQ